LQILITKQSPIMFGLVNLRTSLVPMHSLIIKIDESSF